MPLFKRTLSEFLFRRFVLKHYAGNLLLDLQLDAKKESLAYLKEHMPDAQYFEKHPEMLRYVVGLADQPGLVLEFGVGRGKSIRWIASQTDKPVVGFDSFEGIPEYWNGNPIGAFSQSKLPKVPANVSFEIGMFDVTLPGFLEQNAGPISFLLVDCDLYSSTCSIFALLGARLQPGAIILFDEYFNFPRWQQHEFKGFQEWVTVAGVEYEYVAYSVTGQQAAVRVLKNPSYEAAN